MSKKRIRWWAVMKRIQYGSGFATFWVLLAVFLYVTNYYNPANCFDGMYNQNETGIDCGGKCVAICAADVLPPRVLWAKSFLVDDNQYNTVAYVENPNPLEASPALKYTFTMYDGEEVVAERSGITILPPGSVYPVFEGRVKVAPGEEITETKIAIDYNSNWLPASVYPNQFITSDLSFFNTDRNPRLDATIANNAVIRAEDVEVVATIFDRSGNPVTTSQTFIERIEGRSNADIVFTWPSSIAKHVRSCSIPTDVAVVIDLSGSMNDDGGNPPQPVTDALKAASQFVDTLAAEDQVALVTFATEAQIISELTPQTKMMAEMVNQQMIEPKEETGFTNTPAALLFAQRALNSTRHNANARRVVVLLTDGLPTAPGDAPIGSMTKEAANELLRDNIEMYAIGLGERVDRAFINGIVGDPTNAYLAPSVDELAAIYKEITASLCDQGPTNIDIIAKSKTNFAPLR